MKSSFTLQLQDATRAEEITGITSFVGEDASGSFGILPNHARMLTVLVTGLARFRVGPDSWQYLAVPGALLYFQENVLTLGTRRYLLDADYKRISEALQQQLLAEEEQLQAMTISLHRMEEAMLKHLWDMGRRNAG
ncbi:MAG: F0F1 ATP synthase subunit epsilon [Gammaproteobacteria bacterium]